MMWSVCGSINSALKIERNSAILITNIFPVFLKEKQANSVNSCLEIYTFLVGFYGSLWQYIRSGLD